LSIFYTKLGVNPHVIIHGCDFKNVCLQAPKLPKIAVTNGQTDRHLATA